MKAESAAYWGFGGQWDEEKDAQVPWRIIGQYENSESRSELPLDYRVQFAHSTLVVGVTSRSNFPAMYR
jgi:hypothetical protein